MRAAARSHIPTFPGNAGGWWSVQEPTALPIVEELEREAQARQLELLEIPTARAIEELAKRGKETNAILHVTC